MNDTTLSIDDYWLVIGPQSGSSSGFGDYVRKQLNLPSNTCCIAVKPRAEMPLTPLDLDWFDAGKMRNWTERDVTWTKLSTGEAVTVRQHCREKIDSGVSLEDLRKTADVRAAYPHLLVLNSAPNTMWVADL